MSLTTCPHGAAFCSEGCHDMVSWEPGNIVVLADEKLTPSGYITTYTGIDEWLCWLECLANGEEFYAQ